jgi:hypothetical protein
MWESRIVILGDASALVESGPMRMFIEGSAEGPPRPGLCEQAARASLRCLQEIADHRKAMSAAARDIPEPPRDLLIHAMWEAALVVGDRDLTPMAAVAGTIADAAADLLMQWGLTRVIVNNGGDIAIRLKQEERVTVGVRPDVTKPEITHRIALAPEMDIGGVCTSGLGGRSFTRGIASAATVFAGRAAVADAAATAVANATFVQARSVRTCRADLIDPDTDLQGVEITIEVGDLSKEEIETGLRQGITRAEELAARGVIKGAVIAIQGCVRATSRLRALLQSLE